MLELGDQTHALHDRIFQEAVHLSKDMALDVSSLFHGVTDRIGCIGLLPQETLPTQILNLLQTRDTIPVT